MRQAGGLKRREMKKTKQQMKNGLASVRFYEAQALVEPPSHNVNRQDALAALEFALMDLEQAIAKIRRAIGYLK